MQCKECNHEKKEGPDFCRVCKALSEMDDMAQIISDDIVDQYQKGRFKTHYMELVVMTFLYMLYGYFIGRAAPLLYKENAIPVIILEIALTLYLIHGAKRYFVAFFDCRKANKNMETIAKTILKNRDAK